MLPTDQSLLEAAEDVLIESALHPRFHNTLKACQGQRHTLDDRPIRLHKLFHHNNNEDNIADDELASIKKLKPGEHTNLGGGAFATFKLKRIK